ncbi:MAG: hypothetical protein GU361_01540 [Desulfurococcales archaeon]|nr:hypothetical protein [Desulfurococcales archaeon]
MEALLALLLGLSLSIIRAQSKKATPVTGCQDILYSGNYVSVNDISGNINGMSLIGGNY